MVAACHPLIVAMKPKRTFFLKEEKQLNFGKTPGFLKWFVVWALDFLQGAKKGCSMAIMTWKVSVLVSTPRAN
jgi:hypothetical protein